MQSNIFIVSYLFKYFMVYLFRQRDCKIKSFYPWAAHDYFLLHPADG